MIAIEHPRGPTLSPRPRPPLPAGPFLVAGLGRAGRAAVEALKVHAGPEHIVAWDADTRPPMQRLRRKLEADGVSVSLGPLPTRLARHVRTVIKSPGLAPTHELLERAPERGQTVLDELELGWRLSRAPVIGVTGTNGKSTVVGLVAEILAASGHRTAVAGNTMFGPPLSALASVDLDAIVCEVSSFQLEGCELMFPEIAALTNLTPEHLGRHRTMQRYGEVKRSMFRRGEEVVARAVLDLDDPLGSALRPELAGVGAEVRSIGVGDEADYQLRGAIWDLWQADLALNTPTGPVRARTQLPGAYNARNYAMALAISDLIGIPRDLAIGAAAAFPGVAGRFEHVSLGQPFPVIVDYGCTEDGLTQFLMAVRAGMAKGGRLRTVLGVSGVAGSAMKRIGATARRLSDDLVLTTAPYLTRPPLLVLRALKTGAQSSNGAQLEVVLDRRQAIAAAVARAVEGDTVVIMGRGSEQYLAADPHGAPIAFDDRVVAAEVLSALGWDEHPGPLALRPLSRSP
ncbi:MAG: Mur ligase family protein [Solirubrobacteraceae bacterium]